MLGREGTNTPLARQACSVEGNISSGVSETSKLAQVHFVAFYTLASQPGLFRGFQSAHWRGDRAQILPALQFSLYSFVLQEEPRFYLRAQNKRRAGEVSALKQRCHF